MFYKLLFVTITDKVIILSELVNYIKVPEVPDLLIISLEQHQIYLLVI